MMMILTLMVMVMVMVANLPHQVHCFNLYQSKAKLLEGPPESDFGYSVALWSPDVYTKRIVVGAPRSKESPLGNGSVPIGSIYTCDLDSPGCNVDHRTPTLSTYDQSHQALTFNNTVWNNGIGFGQALATNKNSNKSLLAACAPRYPRKVRDKIENRGACFIMRNQDDSPDRIVPYLTPSDEKIQNVLSGFSAALIDENNQASVVMGGPFAFKGAGVVDNVLLSDRKKYGNRYNIPTETGEDNFRNTFEGWAVVVGKFDGLAHSIATSAVNYGSLTGKVTFYPQLMDAEEFNPDNYLRILNGKETGAKFGYSLASGDFNADGYDDLIVGAPLARGEGDLLFDAGKVFIFYSPLQEGLNLNTEPQTISGRESWGRLGLTVTSLGDLNRDSFDDVAIAAPNTEEGGTIFIHYGGPEGLQGKHMQVLHSSDFSGGLSHFGFSLDGGVDVDGNGYPDMVVGAVGSDKALLIRSAPIITLVGSVKFDSEAVKVDNKSCFADSAGYKRVKGVCFNLQGDFQYKSLQKYDAVSMEFRMVLEGASDPPPFVFLANNDHRYRTEYSVPHIDETRQKWSVSVFSRSNRSIIGQPVRASVTVTLVPSDPPEGNAPEDNHDPIPPVLDRLMQTNFSAGVILTCENNQTCFSKPDMTLSAEADTLDVGEGPTAINVTIEVKDDPAYNVEVNLKHPVALIYHRVSGDRKIPGCRLNKLVGVIEATKLLCTFEYIEADETVNFAVYFDHKPLAVLDYMEEHGTQSLQVKLRVSSDSIDTNIDDNKLNVDMPVQTKAVLFTDGGSRPEVISIRVNETVTTGDVKKASDDPTFTFPIEHLGPAILHDFELTNRGPSPVRNAELVFHLPLVTDDSQVMYLYEEPRTEGPSVICSWPRNVIDSLNLKPQKTSPKSGEEALSRRRRRSQHKRNVADQDVKGSGDVNFGTSDIKLGKSLKPASAVRNSRTHRSRRAPNSLVKNVDCFIPECRITCNVGGTLLPGETVKVTFSSFITIASLDKLGSRSVAVRSWLDAQVSQNGSIVINQERDVTTFITLLKPPVSSLFAVPLWILLLAVLGSILVILLLIVLLWRAGFFKRNRPPVERATRTKSSLITAEFVPSSTNTELKTIDTKM